MANRLDANAHCCESVLMPQLCVFPGNGRERRVHVTWAGQIGQMELPCRCEFRCQGIGEWLRRHDFLLTHVTLSSGMSGICCVPKFQSPWHLSGRRLPGRIPMGAMLIKNCLLGPVATMSRVQNQVQGRTNALILCSSFREARQQR